MSSAISLKITSAFFDRALIEDAMGKAEAKAVNKAAAQVRLIAKRSMRRRSARIQLPGGGWGFAPSEPGKPPYAHAGQLRDLLYYYYEPEEKTAVIGPIPFKNGDAPQLNEFGGTVQRTHVRFITVNRQKQRQEFTVSATYPKRPFMGPALDAVKPDLPQYFAGILGS